MDVAWAPAVPPGHTFFSWDSDQFETQAQLQGYATIRKESPVKIHTSVDKPRDGATKVTLLAQKPAASTQSAKPNKTKPEVKEVKSAPVDTTAILQQITEAVRSWSPTDEKHELSLASKLTVLENGSLKWNKEEKRSIESIPTALLDQMTKEVEQCIATRSGGVSQGLHDKYMQYIMNKPEGARQHGQIGGGHSLYIRGLTLLHGIGSAIDKKNAVLFLHQAAEEGVPEAISLLGYCYEMGDGVAVQPKRAVQCYKAALELGDPHASVRLGRCLWGGISGVLEKDRERAPRLIEEGIAELRARVARNQDGLPGVSRALSLLHSQMSLV